MTKIYIYGVNWIGDAIISLSALEGIRQKSPEIPIIVLSPPRTSQIYELSPAVTSVITFGNGKLPKTPQGKSSVVLCFPLSFRSAWNLWRSGFKNRVGYGSEGRSFLLNRIIDYKNWKNKHLHQSTYYRELAEAVLGPIPLEPSRLRISSELLNKGQQFLLSNHVQDHFRIAINPGAYFGSAKMWPIRFYKTLIGKILEEFPNTAIILFSGEKDRHVTREIFEAFHSPNIISTDGSVPLNESIAILSQCHYLVSNDSGMMHIGAALEMKGVSIFGPTDPFATGPMSKEIRVLSHQVSCSPCFLRECPIDHRCMEFLTPEKVFLEIKDDMMEQKGFSGFRE